MISLIIRVFVNKGKQVVCGTVNKEHMFVFAY